MGFRWDGSSRRLSVALEASGQASVTAPDLRRISRRIMSETPFSRVGFDSWAWSIAREIYGPINPPSLSPSTIEIMRREPQIKLAIKLREAMLLNAQFYAIGETDEAAFVNEAIMMFCPKAVETFARSAVWGFAPHEILWSVADIAWTEEDGTERALTDAYVIEGLADLAPKNTTIKLDGSGRFAALELKDGRHIEARKALIVTNAEEFGNLYGRSELIDAHSPWWSKGLTSLYLLRYLEKKGDPPLIGRVPSGMIVDGAGNKQNPIAVMNAVMANIRGSGAASIPYHPHGDTGENQWGLEEMKVADRVEEFMPALQWFDAQILRSLLVPDRAVTQDAGRGSNAEQSGHFSAALQLLEEAKAMLVVAPLQLLAEMLIRANFGARAPVPVIEATAFSPFALETLRSVLRDVLHAPHQLKNGEWWTAAHLVDKPRMLKALAIPHRRAHEVSTKEPPAPPTNAPRTARAPMGGEDEGRAADRIRG